MILLLLVSSLIVNAQCEENFHPTGALHVVYTPMSYGAGIEGGLTGDILPWNIYGGVSAFIYTRTELDKNGEPVLVRKPPMGAVYVKGGLRLMRIPYQFSMYALGSLGVSDDMKPVTTVSLRLLYPQGYWAVSIEPLYSPSQGRAGVMASIHFQM